MKKSELIERISSQNPHLFQRDIEKIVSAIIDEIVQALRCGDRVELRGFGAFSIKVRRGDRIVVLYCSALRPLLAQSGHPSRAAECPLLGVKRTCRLRNAMSAFDPKRTSARRSTTCV
jgi:hypothetical protein